LDLKGFWVCLNLTQKCSILAYFSIVFHFFGSHEALGIPPLPVWRGLHPPPIFHRQSPKLAKKKIHWNCWIHFVVAIHHYFPHSKDNALGHSNYKPDGKIGTNHSRRGPENYYSIK